jgi:transposase
MKSWSERGIFGRFWVVLREKRDIGGADICVRLRDRETEKPHAILAASI